MIDILTYYVQLIRMFLLFVPKARCIDSPCSHISSRVGALHGRVFHRWQEKFLHASKMLAKLPSYFYLFLMSLQISNILKRCCTIELSIIYYLDEILLLLIKLQTILYLINLTKFTSYNMSVSSSLTFD